VSAVASLLALVLTPLNFTWMVSTNPATAGWLRTLDIDASDIWFSLLALLAVPMAAGPGVSHRLPALTARIQKPLANFSPAGAAGFHRAGPGAERQLLTLGLLPHAGLVVLHNACGLAFGWLAPAADGVANATAAP
jgi:BASS family bile acid:Na+ symporter